MPEEEPIVATDGLLLLHVPPAEESVSVAGMPVQARPGPAMGETRLITLMVVVAVHPEGTV